jgi:hypothetical protein
MPMRSELQISNVQWTDRQPAVSEVWSWIATAVTNPELGMIALFCAVGLWLTFLFIHLSPDFGAMAEALQPFA